MPTNNILRIAIQTVLRQPAKNLSSLGYAALLLTASASGQTTSAPTTVDEKKIAQQIETQSESTETQPEKAEEPEEVVIVGSRIRRSTFNSPSPVKVVTREEATAAGFNSTTEMLQGTGVTTGASQINNAYGGYVTNGGPGANTISLRGLGEGRTLVLINGRRVAPAGTRGAVGSADLNVLPTAMIERVEVLRDGASSVYGSDAIGGVVNVITMDAVEGIVLEGEFNQPTEGSGEQTRFSISGGMSEDRWSFSGSLDFYDRADLTLGDRDWTRCNVDGLRDPETGESLDYIDPATGSPKCYPVSGTGSNGVTVNTIGTQSVNADNWADLGLNGPIVGAPGSAGTTFTRFRPNSAVATGIPGYEGVGGGINSLNVRDTFEPRMLNESLISPVRIYTTFLQGKYDLQAMGEAEIYFELLGSRRESTQTGYRQLSMDYRLGSPSIPDELSFADFAPDQGTSDGERVGVRAFIGFGNDKNEQAVDFYKPTVGIRGDLTFLPDWKYETYISHSKSDAEYRVQSYLTDKLTYASDVVAAPAGTDASLVRDGLTCNVNLTDPSQKCVPFPILTPAVVSGALPRDFRDYIFRDVVGHTKYDESVLSAVFDGPLYTLPAGKIQGVIGLEHRRAEIDDQPDPNSVAGNLYNLTVSAPTTGKDNVSEIYTELEIPILASVPFAKELTINGSYRYTDYDSYGSGNTYKFGVVYSPASWISFRGTKGTSFRAPALFEQYQGATSGFLSSNGDPCNNYGADDVNPNRAANCALELPGLPEFQATNGIETFNVGGAEAGLSAETSENLTYGVILQPDLGEDHELSVALDYFHIKIDNGVAQAGAGNILELCYDDPNFQLDESFCRLVSRDPDTKQLSVSDAFTNLATQTSRGIDLTTRYGFDMGPGDFVVNMSVTRYLEQATKLFDDDPLEDLNGVVTYPEWSGTGDISYELDKWRFTYGVEWVGSMDSYKFAEEDPETSELDLTTDIYIEHRISLRYSADNWETTVGVRNLTNEVPQTISAFVHDRVGNAPLYSGYDFVGRELFVNMQWQF